MARYEMGQQNQAINPWGAAAAGAAVGVAGDQAVSMLRSAKSRASWALGIGVGLLALGLINQGNINTAQTQTQAAAQGAAAIAFDSSSLATVGTGLATLRSVFIQGMNAAALGFYYSNPWNSLFNSQPVAVPFPIQAGAITTTTVTSSSNQNLGILLVVGVGVAALALS